MLPFLIPAIVGAASGIGQIFGGIGKNRQANRAAARNQRPVYNPLIPQGDFEALSLLKSRAGQGLSDASKMVYQQNADRGLTSQIDAILKSGGNPNDISKVGQGYADNISRLALADDAARIANINAFLGQQRRVSDMQREDNDKSFQINQYAPYLDEQARIAQLRGMGQQQVAGGINTLASGALNYAANLGQKQDIAAINGGNVDWLGRTTYTQNIPPTQPLSNAQNNFTNNWGMPNNNDVGSWGTGYDWSQLSPSARAELSGLLKNQFDYYG